VGAARPDRPAGRGALTDTGPGWQFWIDRGGTFTDIVARDPGGGLRTGKKLSENPGRYEDAAIAGIRDMLGLEADAKLPPGAVQAVKMGTTVATNALLQRQGARTLLLVNRGFADLLLIGNQTRPRLFDLRIARPTPLYEQVVEVGGRVGVDGEEIERLNEAGARAALEAAFAGGLRACAIVLLHAWKHPAHEVRLGELARGAGFTQVSLSHEVSSLIGLVARGDTSVADAYLSPVLGRYVAQVEAALGGVQPFFMQSNGGLARAFRGKDAVLSGPAGGIVGAARTAEAAGFGRVISLDMGGTSTDVALYDGAFARGVEAEIAGVRLRAPMLDIHTVAAGGGSVLRFDGARLLVGPQSAGADPGPACYRRGGPLTVTDANLLLGRIQARHFPAIFGPAGDQALDLDVVVARFGALADEVFVATAERRPAAALAAGFVRIAVANIAAAIKKVSLEKGRDARDFTLCCFGGAGGQHACLVADELGMDTVFIPRLAGVLSAYGIGLADQVVVREQSIEMALEEAALPAVRAAAETLGAAARDALVAQGAAAERIEIVVTAQVRYDGTGAALPVALLGDVVGMRAAFTAVHRERFGFASPGRGLVVASIMVEARAAGEPVVAEPAARRVGGSAEPVEVVTLYCGGETRQAPVLARDALCSGDVVAGPALVSEAHATTIVEPGWAAEITARNDMVLRRVLKRDAAAVVAVDRADPVLLEVFGNLFMYVAEQTGIVLRNTAASVNIKERLDFSCAIFNAQGALIANAPHVPVHLGAMSESVRTVLRRFGGSLRPGDVVVLNNPFDGGTHLPDITVITPVFGPDRALRLFVANRGHHADIGGVTPGSTPPFSSTLEEEGVLIDCLRLVEGGEFQDAAVRAVLTGGRYPARAPDTNIADMKAQVAANAAGVRELDKIVARYGWSVVGAYLGHVLRHGEASVRQLLRRLQDGAFEYRMDDGAMLCVAVRIDRAAGSACIDFTGSGARHAHNFNAPPAITRAAVLYVLRCLLGDDVPLNDGCLEPIEIVIPPGTFLSPAPGAAVVAGNTEVSQAVTNALFGAFGALACAQGTMNNFLFGDAEFQYYETICGGAGAGPDFDGASAVHTHMTNTRITDPEVLELRYPVRLETFAVRRGSGGDGVWHGGDGAVRRVRFLRPMQAVIVSSRRTVAPFGMAGGADGACGRQWIERVGGEIERLEGVAGAEMGAGDVFAIETPGGGGWGKRK
jgi:5-oxoprolinase (ATP-hydrolysing)